MLQLYTLEILIFTSSYTMEEENGFANTGVGLERPWCLLSHNTGEKSEAQRGERGPPRLGGGRFSIQVSWDLSPIPPFGFCLSSLDPINSWVIMSSRNLLLAHHCQDCVTWQYLYSFSGAGRISMIYICSLKNDFTLENKLRVLWG